ncbi:hypothetical protein BK126_01135 [Paenibacillus sp. FSL H7-0326]|uniref:hydroxyacid dehydrogenase n=1 Tax=Paenibacillus sp. FSL H7-0326 TaxID=1921144 RepID=UPI00096CD7C8|nr:hydroxyacid dehydrogenase [Paenibacillus sp. FSL H7-0326]OMC70757.1 hypothetical protein BK126_01135 [Paenibacillus sp. FSL H7-0326]
MTKIVIVEAMGETGLELLQKSEYSVKYDPTLWSDHRRLIEASEHAEVLIVRNQTQLTRELLDELPRVKVIGRLGVGLDNIDVEAASSKGIPIVSAKNANAASVAEYVMASILTVNRPLIAATRDVISGGWDRKKFGGREIQGTTLGLIGVGQVGRLTGSKAQALGLHVIGYDPMYEPGTTTENAIALKTLEEVLAESDYVSLHVPLLPETRHLIDRTALQRMKSTAYVINTARGGVVHELDLVEALEAGEIAGAVLDVLEQEPPPSDHPLFSVSNCILTPHVAGATEEALNRTSLMVAAEVIKELEGEASEFRVAEVARSK